MSTAVLGGELTLSSVLLVPPGEEFKTCSSSLLLFELMMLFIARSALGFEGLRGLVGEDCGLGALNGEPVAFSVLDGEPLVATRTLPGDLDTLSVLLGEPILALKGLVGEPC